MIGTLGNSVIDKQNDWTEGDGDTVFMGGEIWGNTHWGKPWEAKRLTRIMGNGCIHGLEIA